MNTFEDRIILVEFKFKDTGETVTVDNLRTSVSVVQGFGVAQGQLQLAIEGLRLETMNRLATIGFIKAENKGNTVTVMAGDATAGLSMLFKGTILQAYMDANQQPHVIFNVIAKPAVEAALSTQPATSKKGEVKIADIFKGLAEDAGLTFSNKGVDTLAENVYLTGSTLDKIRTLAKAYAVLFTIHNEVLTIWYDKTTSNEKKPLLIAAGSGEATLIGYPTHSGNMLEIDVLFTTKVAYYESVEVQCHVETSNGTWRPRRIAHNLQSKTPNGAWYTHLSCDKMVLK